MMMLWGSQPDPTLEESQNSLSVPVSGPIPLSLLDQEGRDFHTLYREGPRPGQQEAVTEDLQSSLIIPKISQRWKSLKGE